LFRRYCIQPAKTIVNLIRASHPDVPIIGFPRQAGRLALDYVQGTGVNAVGIDQMIPTRWAAQSLQPLACVQGNLDPVCLLTGGDAMRENVQSILGNLAGGPFVFNLGHGIIKETPPDHVAQLVAMVREYSTGKA
jgi:uroporphyrinogen decarboxylase